MIHDVNTRTLYPLEKRVEVYRVGETSQNTPEHFRLDSTSLFWGIATDGKNINYMQAHILPVPGIQVVKFAWKAHFPDEDKIDYYIDIVNITEHSDKRWHVRDLYLDVIIIEGERAEVLDTDEYLAAIEAGFLGQEEAAFALTSLHELMNALAKHGYSLEAYLASHNIHLDWV